MASTTRQYGRGCWSELWPASWAPPDRAHLAPKGQCNCTMVWPNFFCTGMRRFRNISEHPLMFLVSKIYHCKMGLAVECSFPREWMIHGHSVLSMNVSTVTHTCTCHQVARNPESSPPVPDCYKHWLSDILDSAESDCPCQTLPVTTSDVLKITKL